MRINELIRNDPKRLQDYNQRVAMAKEKMDALGWGARAQCARDTELGPSAVTDTLNKNRLSLSALEQIEDWLEGTDAEENPGVHI